MKMIIAGSRTFDNYSIVKNELEGLIEEIQRRGETVEIVSGGARGADALGERLAEELGLKCTVFPAQWDMYGQTAGFIRNAEMADYADCAYVFWDGRSHGAWHMISTMERKGKKVWVYES